MPVTDFIELSKNRILVIGGYLQDIEITGSGHDASVTSRPGGSAYNVAMCLSYLGIDVLFLSCFSHGKGVGYAFDSLPVQSDCQRGIFLYRGTEVLAVQRPSRPTMSGALRRLLEGEKFALAYATLEIGVESLSLLDGIDSRYRILDPSPGIELKNLSGLEKFDYILANDHTPVAARESKLIIKAGAKGAIHRGVVYSPPLPGTDKLGSGDLFGAVFSYKLLLGQNAEEALKWAVLESSRYCLFRGSLSDYLFQMKKR